MIPQHLCKHIISTEYKVYNLSQVDGKTKAPHKSYWVSHGTLVDLVNEFEPV